MDNRNNQYNEWHDEIDPDQVGSTEAEAIQMALDLDYDVLPWDDEDDQISDK